MSLQEEVAAEEARLGLVPCPECDGIGVVANSNDNLGISDSSTRCPRCNGRRKVPAAALQPQEPAEAPEAAPWGWWTVFTQQAEFRARLAVELPSIDDCHDLSEASNGELTDRLGRMGAALGYLHSNQGAMLGQLRALKETFETATDTAKARLPRGEIKGTTTEAAKLQMVLAGDHSEVLRDLRKRIITLEACTSAQDGMLRAYQTAWETLSRALTSRTAEMALDSRR